MREFMTKPLSDCLQRQLLTAELSLASGLDGRMLGLLAAIEATGSLNKAAKLQGLSYKGAWQIIERANNATPCVLINTAIGGSKGGGSQLTPAGKRLLAVFKALQLRHAQFITQLNAEVLADPDISYLLKPLLIKTSAGNQLFSRIVAIQPGAVSVELSLQLKSGVQILASLDKALYEQYQPQLGDELLALVPAFEIGLYDNLEGLSLSARNCLPVELVRFEQDGVVAEVALSLGGGESLFASVTADTIDRMALLRGQSLYAVFKANAVLLAFSEKP